MNRFSMGPALLVTAAFVGPGTILTASTAGAEFGFSLLWAVLFSVIAAIVLQEMAARLGIVSGSGLAESLRDNVSAPVLRSSLLVLVLGGILFGNIAYQTGNIIGAAKGLEMLSTAEPAPTDPTENGKTKTGQRDQAKTQTVEKSGQKTYWAVGIAIAALILIWIGRFDVIQVCLSVLVGLMGVLFFASAISCKPDIVQIFAGFIPSLPPSEHAGRFWLLVIAMIGTTVVPYNLFLHASSAATKWSGSKDQKTSVRHSFWDTVIAVSIGGVITGSLVVTAASLNSESTELKDIAVQLRPVIGKWSDLFFGIGLLAAGLTSSITAPIAAAYATAGCFGWDTRLSNPRLKIVATIVVAIGLGFAIVANGSPKEAIIFAQILNGLLLPIIASFLLYIVNRKKLMADMKNGRIANSLGFAIVAFTFAIAARQFYLVWLKIDWKSLFAFEGLI